MDNLQPASLPTTLDLSNGQTVTIRPIRPSDAPLLVEMFQHLSERTKRLRFHAFTGNLPQERIWRQALALSDLDPAREVALVAVHADDAGEHIVGVARFVRATADAVEAEAAVVVRDDFQRMGLGSQLLSLLLPLAQSMGIQRLFGWIMAENRHMMQIIKKTDLPVHRENHSGEMFVVITLPS
jgi:acetyltransferase